MMGSKGAGEEGPGGDGKTGREEGGRGEGHSVQRERGMSNLQLQQSAALSTLLALPLAAGGIPRIFSSRACGAPPPDSYQNSADFSGIVLSSEMSNF